VVIVKHLTIETTALVHWEFKLLTFFSTMFPMQWSPFVNRN